MAGEKFRPDVYRIIFYPMAVVIDTSGMVSPLAITAGFSFRVGFVYYRCAEEGGGGGYESGGGGSRRVIYVMSGSS